MPTLDPIAAPAALSTWLAEIKLAVDAELTRRLAPPAGLSPGDPTARLCEAIAYAALGAGKRLRPAIAVAACEAVGGDFAAAAPAAAAIELVHAYTLVHDDLPAMDDDDERRGRPTVHRQFDEATAILAGDALLTLGFACLAELGPRAADAVAVMGARAGGELLGGQARDLAAASSARALSFAELEAIHLGKTGALFAAAAELGGIAGGASPDARALLADYGIALGVSFQHADDRDDGEHPDHADAAAARARELGERAIELAERLGGRAGRLRDIARWIARAG